MELPDANPPDADVPTRAAGFLGMHVFSRGEHRGHGYCRGFIPKGARGPIDDAPIPEDTVVVEWYERDLAERIPARLFRRTLVRTLVVD